MLFFLTTMNPQGESREFSLIGDLELGCQLFDHIAQTGDILIKATVVEGNRSSELPLDSLSGQVCVPDMEAMQSEWQHLLNKPLDIRWVCSQRLPTLISKRIERHSVCVFKLEQAVEAAEQRFERVFDHIYGEPHRTRLLTQLEMVLKRHRQSLATERASLQVFLGQLPPNLTS